MWHLQDLQDTDILLADQQRQLIKYNKMHSIWDINRQTIKPYPANVENMAGSYQC